MEIEAETTYTLIKDGQTIELTIDDVANIFGTLMDRGKLFFHIPDEDIFHVNMFIDDDCLNLVLNCYVSDDDDLDLEETNWQQEGL